MRVDTLIAGGTVVLPGTDGRAADVLISDGKIAGIVASADGVDAAERIDAGGKVVLPGGIDPHLHLGIYNHVEQDWRAETRAAVAGGVTTIVPYLFYRDPYSVSLPREIALGEANSIVDFGLTPGIITEEHLAAMEDCIAEFGINSFKFSGHWKGFEKKRIGSDTTLDDGLLFQVLEKAGAHPRVRICVHCQNVELSYPPFASPESRHFLVERNKHLSGLALWEALNPDFTETEYLRKLIYLAGLTGASVYAVHISAGSSVEYLRTVDMRGLDTFAETCTHYLGLTVDAPAGLLAKVNPPVRKQSDQDTLWKGLAEGTLLTVGTDSCPCNTRTKFQGGDGVREAKLGFPSTNTVLPVLATHGWARRGLSLGRLAEVYSSNSARIFGLYPTKGAIAVGSDADLVIADFETEREVAPAELPGGADYSVFAGQRLVGWPVRTLVRGKTVWHDGHVTMEPGYGRYLRRGG